MHLLRKNMDAPNAANRCLNGNYSSWFNSQGNLKNVSQNEQYFKIVPPPRVQSNRLSNAVRPSSWCVSNDSVIVVMKV